MTVKKDLRALRSIQNAEHSFYLEFINGMMSDDDKQAWDRLKNIMDVFDIPTVR